MKLSDVSNNASNSAIPYSNGLRFKKIALSDENEGLIAETHILNSLTLFGLYCITCGLPESVPA